MKNTSVSLFALALATSFGANFPLHAQTATPSTNLAKGKKYVSSDLNTAGWDGGLTDGSWRSERENTYATGNSTVFPKTVTIDLEAPVSLGYVAIGVPPFGSTKTVKVSLSEDGVTFTEVGSTTFSLKKEEKHLFDFAAQTARYVRLTYVDNYTENAGYPPVHAFTTEVAVYAPGAAPVLPTTPTGPEPTDVGAPKLGAGDIINEGFLKSHQSFLQRIKEGPIGVLFIGDSITNRWRNNDELWKRAFGKYNPANFGIEGDKTQHVLWRFDNGELEGINPKVVVVMIGTNNMGYPAEDIIKGDKKIVAEIHRRLPETKVLLLGIFPRGAEATNPARAKLKGINAELAKLDDGNQTRFFDFGDKFLEADGTISKEMMPDALHPTSRGYEIWADAISPLLAEMMRP
ncbi:hypothetical protein EON83_21540 [bacterium]|nr:MAG: hypothetical protein EON83_21540 [bacterium]